MFDYTIQNKIIIYIQRLENTINQSYINTFKTELFYSNNELIKIDKYSLKGTSILKEEVLFSNLANTLTIKNNITFQSIVFNSDNYYITSINLYSKNNDDLYKNYTITYYDNYSTITEPLNNLSYYYFDNLERISYEMDSNASAKEYSFNDNNKLISESSYQINRTNFIHNDLISSGHLWNAIIPQVWLNIIGEGSVNIVNNSSILQVSSLVGDHSFRIVKDASLNTNFSIYQIIDGDFKQGDEFTLNYFYNIPSNTSEDIIGSVNVCFYKDDQLISEYISNVYNNTNNVYFFKSFSFKLLDKSDKIEVHLSSNIIDVPIDFASISLYKKKKTNKEYFYNLNGQISKYRSANKSNVYAYNNFELTEELKENEYIVSEYNEDHDLVIKKSNYTKTINTYNQRHNILSSTLIGFDNKFNQTSLTYKTALQNDLNNDYIENITDNENKQTIVDTDLVYLNTNQISKLNYLKSYTYSNYNLKDNYILSKNLTNLGEVSYEYYHDGIVSDKIKYVITSNVVYYYLYNAYGDLESIKYGKTKQTCTNTLVSYSYLTKNATYTGKIEYIYYSTNKYIKYEYDNKLNITSIRPLNTSFHSFTYDCLNRLATISDNLVLTTSYPYQSVYTYNEDDVSEIKHYNSSALKFSEKFHKDNFFNQRIFLFNDLMFSNLSYELGLNKGLCFNTLMNSYIYQNNLDIVPSILENDRNYVCTFIDTKLKCKFLQESGESGLYEINETNNILSTNPTDKIPYFNTSGVNVLRYNITSLDTFTISFMFKLNGNDNNKCIFFMLNNDTYDSNYIKLIKESNTYSFYYKGLTGIEYRMSFTNSLKEYNFLCIRRSYNDIYINLNEEMVSVSISNLSLLNNFFIGGIKLDNYQNITNTNIYTLMYSKKVKDNIEVTYISEVLNDYIFSKIDDIYLNISLSNNTFDYLDNLNINYTFFPLNNSLNNTKDDEFLTLKYTNIYSYIGIVLNKNDKFIYDKTIKNFVYRSYIDSYLEYDSKYLINSKNTFIVNIKPIKNLLTRMYIFYIEDSENNTYAGLYLGQNGYLYFDMNGTSLVTTISISFNTFSKIMFSIEKVNDKYKYTVMYDSDGYTYTDSNSYLLSSYMLKISKGLSSYIESLLISDDYIDTDTLDNYKTEKTIYSYDSLSYLKGKNLSIINNHNISYTYTYDSTNNQVHSNILNELIKKDNQTLKNYNYTYDSFGNITSIKEGSIEKHKYYYNDLNYLIREDLIDEENYIEYNYTYNGNITTKIKKNLLDDTLIQTINYTYDNTFYDKLISYNNTSITYDNNINTSVKTYIKNGITYNIEYLVKRVSRIYNSNISCYYKYNSNNQRIIKEYSTNKYNYYYYSNNKLIKEERYDNSLITNIYYLYDLDNLYGFIIDNVRYYYIKNILGIITDIVDSSGISVVQYKYDGFGNIISITGSLSNTIGIINPYRYKSYYYDTESGLYYLVNRYYNSEWGRFISLDDTSYLDIDSINGLNLYVYCANNPIMGYDPEGTFGISLLIGAIIGFLSVYIPDVAEGIKKDGFQVKDLLTINKDNLLEYGCNFIGGALTSLIGGLNISCFIAAPLVGAVNTFVEFFSGNIESLNDGLECFAESTIISIFTLGSKKMALKYKKPIISRGIPTKSNKFVEKMLFMFEKGLYNYSNCADDGIAITLIIFGIL